MGTEGCKIKNISEGSIVHCANQRLSVFPNLPSNTITADLHGNVLPFLRRENFKRLRNVKSLTLSNCNTKGIEEDREGPVTRQTYRRERILSEKKMATGQTKEMKGKEEPFDFLDIRDQLEDIHMKLDVMVNVNATFQTKAPTFKLHLLDNKLRKLDRKDLTPLRNVKHLTINLRRNRIANIAQDTFVDLKNIVKLDVSENPLCQNNAQETNESLEDINVQSWPSCNAAYNLSLALRSTKVANLVLEHIGWKTYQLKEDDFVNLKNSSLRLLKLGGNNFGRIPEDAFQHVSTLHSLFLDNCAIDTIPANAFAPLKWLRSLHLERNNLETVLVQNVLDFCPRLSFIDVSGNKFKNSLPNGTIERYVIANHTKISTIKLSHNNLNLVFQEGLFEGLDSLTTIDISTNKLICDCQIRPLQKWLDNHKHITVKGRHDYCFVPASTTNKRIQEYRPSWLDCDNNLVILLASSSGSLFCVVTIALVIYVLRWDIKFAIAVRRARRFPRKHVRRGKEFDAFVSYCPHDIAWVKDALIAKVEEDQYFNFHLCVHERDFLAGKFIVENIEENVEKSKKIIFVVTESFLASEYCDLEVNLAKTKLFERSIDSVVFICFDMIKKSKMSEPMNTMMRHSCVLYWPQEDRLRERAIFWKKLKLALWSKQDFVMDETLL
ncbi:toll-like receptor 2 [Lingula anatina]|uniref:Toll-like receptor 2 n=1 Tax=Lingula anatina TaxID=7574 RepID=A0A1S3HZG4_LINAN|nr:toll-like receptor 2 [Lingula anatina]|eukprot:XP_013391405.1 toll-like receptor 2 [Lingula anatina]